MLTESERFLRQRLKDKIAAQDIERGRPLTDRERLNNLAVALDLPKLPEILDKMGLKPC